LPQIVRLCNVADTEHSFRVVIVSNQNGIALKVDSKSKAPKANSTSRLSSFKAKVTAVFNQLDIPISIYAATGKDIYRKPRPGIWKEMLEDYDIHNPGDLDLETSIFVGDAGGRVARGNNPKDKDFSCSDRQVF
jgi:bifunctional polynucleotide phosphatase/kinase